MEGGGVKEGEWGREGKRVGAGKRAGVVSSAHVGRRWRMVGILAGWKVQIAVDGLLEVTGWMVGAGGS